MDAIPALGAVTVLPIAEVRPYQRNPRRIPQAAVDIVAKSLAEFGWQQPLVVDTDRVLVVGHTRLLAAKKLGLKTVPVVIADKLTPAQVKAYRIADNRSSDFTSWDFTALTQQLDELAQDFSDVLALADWQAIVADYDELVSPVSSGLGPASDSNNDGDDDEGGAPVSSATAAARPSHFIDPDEEEDDEVVTYLSKEHALVVVCDSERTARRVAAKVIDMPGVTDVRDKR